MMYGVLILLGGMVLACGGVAFSLLWTGWWLYPAWAWVMVPLGLPPITFWKFVALRVFLLTRGPTFEHEPLHVKEKSLGVVVAWWCGYIAWPVVTYYVLAYLAR